MEFIKKHVPETTLLGIFVLCQWVFPMMGWDACFWGKVFGATVFSSAILFFINSITKGLIKIFFLCISLIVLLFLLFPPLSNQYKKEHEKKQEQPKETQISQIFISMPQPNQQPIKMFSVEADKNKSELTATFENSGALDISSNLTVWIGIFPFFGTYNGDHIKWIKSKDKHDIPSHGFGQFTIKNIIEPDMAVMAAIEGKEFPNGLLLDEAGISYTWNYWREGYRTTWKDHGNSVGQTGKMIVLLNKFKECARTHSIDQDYTSCFKE